GCGAYVKRTLRRTAGKTTAANGQPRLSYLIGVTLLWAFSFSLIGVYLAGQVDAYFAVLLRVLLALLVFLPFMRPLPWQLAGKLSALGAVQLGLMYLFYYQSFILLTVPEV